MNKALATFILVASILTLIFRYGLSSAITEKSWGFLIAIAVIYGLSMFASGWYLGKKDNQELPIYDLGFRFHLSTFLVYHAISIIWIISGAGNPNENLFTIYIGMGIWSIFLTIHAIFYLVERRKAIASLDKDELFE